MRWGGELIWLFVLLFWVVAMDVKTWTLVWSRVCSGIGCSWLCFKGLPHYLKVFEFSDRSAVVVGAQRLHLGGLFTTCSLAWL